MTTNSCQICERNLTANKTDAEGKPIMSLHGYERPGDGWLHGACFGARHNPYEISCDRIQPYIDMVTQYRDSRAAFIKSMRENPPETLTFRAYPGSKDVEELARPEGFDSTREHYSGSYRTYQGEFGSRINRAEWDITKADREITRMQTRLSNWKPV